jgi:hypothetical protein
MAAGGESRACRHHQYFNVAARVVRQPKIARFPAKIGVCPPEGNQEPNVRPGDFSSSYI